MRSALNYPHLVAAGLGAVLTDLTFSGATTATVLSDDQPTADGSTYPPQMLGLPGNADLVTVTAGGNDLQFIGSMMFAAVTRAEPDNPLLPGMRGTFRDGIPEPTASRVATAADGLSRIVDRVREKAPGARVLLVDYLTVVTDATERSSEAPFTPAELAVILRIQGAVADAFTTAAKRTGADFVRASALSTGHGIGSRDPWVFGFRTPERASPASFHPNAAGMRAVADEILRRVTTTC